MVLNMPSISPFHVYCYCNLCHLHSDEYLTYAIQNRNEWEERGEQMVKSYLEEIQTNKEKKAAREAKRLKAAAGIDEEEPVKFDDVELEKEV